MVVVGEEPTDDVEQDVTDNTDVYDLSPLARLDRFLVS